MQIHLQRQFEIIPYDVVWNGTIAAEEAKAATIIIPPEPVKPAGPKQDLIPDRIRRVMRELAKAGNHAPTQLEIKAHTDLSVAQINSGLCNLVRMNQAGRVFDMKRGKRQEDGQQRYFLTGEKLENQNVSGRTRSMAMVGRRE